MERCGHGRGRRKREGGTIGAAGEILADENVAKPLWEMVTRTWLTIDQGRDGVLGDRWSWGMRRSWRG